MMTLADLTPREREVAEGVGFGMSYTRIAVRLGISPRTVEVHIATIAAKLLTIGFGDREWGPYRRVERWMATVRANPTAHVH